MGAAARAINATHQYLAALGAEVAPDKSMNFASTKQARKWMEETWWDEIQAHIKVVQDFRYLGAHFTTAANCISKTSEARLTTAIAQLKRLKYVPATIEMKIQFMRPVGAGRAVCEGRFLRRGRSLSFMESRFYGPDGKLAGLATATWKMP